MQNAQFWAARSVVVGWWLVPSGRSGCCASRGCAFSEAPIPCHEGFEHMGDECDGIDGFTVGLRVQRGVAVDVGFQAGRAGEGQFDGLGFGQWAEA